MALKYILLVVPCLLIVYPVLIIIVTPFILLRAIAKCLAKMKPELGEVLTTTSAFVFSMDDVQGRPHSNLVVAVQLSGKITLEKMRPITLKNVLTVKNPDGSLKFKELKQYPVSYLRFPFYKWDRNFDVNNHVKSYTKKITNEEDFSKYLSSLNYLPWKKNRSLWELILLDNYEPNGENSSVFIFRCHHSLADGYSLVNLLIKHLGGDRSVEAPAPTSIKIEIWKKVAQWLCFPLLMTYDIIKELSETTDVNAFRTKDRKLMSKLTNSIICDKVPVVLIKEIMAAHSVSFHAVLCGAIAGGLRKYMFTKQLEIPQILHSVSPAPYPGHSDCLENYFSVQLVAFHVGLDNPIARLKMCDESHKNYRRSTLPLVYFYFQKLTGIFFISIQKLLVHHYYNSTIIFSSFPISLSECTFQGIPINSIWGTLGCMEPRCGISITCSSYNRNMQILVVTDNTIFPSSEDTRSLARFITEEFTMLKKIKNE